MRGKASITTRLIVATALLGLIVGGCSNYIAQQKQQEAEIKAADAALDQDRILVQPGSLALAHESLGSVEYSEPFSAQSNDESHIDHRLRELAIAKWGDQVDAIVGVKTALSSDAKELRVSGEAVRVSGDCSFCRHQGGYPQGK